MGLIEKLKMLIKSAKPAGVFINQVKGARLKYKTIPFWTSLIGSLIALVASLQGFIPATTGILITTGLGAGYNILRGVDKVNQTGITPALRSTEFWIGSLAVISTSLIDLATAGITGPVLTTAQTVVAAAMAVAQNLGAQEPPASVLTGQPK